MSKRLVEIRLAAQADMVERYRWYTQEAGTNVAEAMLLAATSAFDTLAESAGLGSPVRARELELAGLRKWRMPGFPNLRIFYVATDQTLFIVRILHTAQDWPAEFGRA